MDPLREIREEGVRREGKSSKAFLALFGLLGLNLESREDQRTSKKLGGSPIALLLLPDPPGLPFSSSWASNSLEGLPKDPYEPLPRSFPPSP